MASDSDGTDGAQKVGDYVDFGPVDGVDFGRDKSFSTSSACITCPRCKGLIWYFGSTSEELREDFKKEKHTRDQCDEQLVRGVMTS